MIQENAYDRKKKEIRGCSRMIWARLLGVEMGWLVALMETILSV
jgi:hypothetical protein